MTTTIKLRRDTAANWASADPTLSSGEPGLDTTNRLLKIGDGATAWTSLSGFDVDGGGGGGSVPSARTSHGGSSITLNGTNWANLPTVSTIAIAATAGDVLEVCAGWLWGTEAVTAFTDIVTEVSASPVNSIASAGAAPSGTANGGISSLTGRSTNAEGASAAATVQYVVQAGDISGGNVTLRLRYRTDTAANKSIASAATHLQFNVKNLGQ